MPSTYDPLLRLELQATGENATTWGTKTNNNLELVAAAIAGISNLTVISGDTSLTTANAATDQARAAILFLTGSPVSTANLIVPASPKTYAIIRNTTGGADIIIKQAAGTGATLPATGNEIIVCTSTTCVGLIGPIDVRLAAVSASVSALNVQVAAVSALTSSLDVRVTDVSAKVSSLDVQVADVSAKVSAVDARVATVSASLSSLNAQVTQIAASVSAINTQLATVSALVSTINALDIRIIE
jgi:hypothetical protein